MGDLILIGMMNVIPNNNNNDNDKKKEKDISSLRTYSYITTFIYFNT